MTVYFNLLLEKLARDYSVLRDLYILVEESAWLTNQALEADDQHQVNELTMYRQQCQESIRATEQGIQHTEEQFKALLAWEYFSLGRLLAGLAEADAADAADAADVWRVSSAVMAKGPANPELASELAGCAKEVQQIICSLARIDVINYNLYHSKLSAIQARTRLAEKRRKAEEAYLGFPRLCGMEKNWVIPEF